MKMTLQCLLALLIGSCLSNAQSPAADDSASSEPMERHFDMLKVGVLSFTNVWVHRQTNYHILIRHDGGIHTIKLTDLPSHELEELKSQIGNLANVEPQSNSNGLVAVLEQFLAKIRQGDPRTLAIGGSGALLLIALVIKASRRGKEPATY